MTENRKHLASVRVVQRNLVFVVGLSQRLADPEVSVAAPPKSSDFGVSGTIGILAWCKEGCDKLEELAARFILDFSDIHRYNENHESFVQESC